MKDLREYLGALALTLMFSPFYWTWPKASVSDGTLVVDAGPFQFSIMTLPP